MKLGRVHIDLFLETFSLKIYHLKYVIIESKTFFNYYDTLKFLKDISDYNLPMPDYLFDRLISKEKVKTQQDKPKYLQGVNELNINGSPMLIENISRVELDSDFDNMLNVSQKQALEYIPRNKLSLVQGPPGTGKTSLIKVFIRILSENKNLWRHWGPIIVYSFSNTGLDNLLEPLLKMKINGRKRPYFIRMGSWSQNEIVKKKHF